MKAFEIYRTNRKINLNFLHFLVKQFRFFISASALAGKSLTFYTVYEQRFLRIRRLLTESLNFYKHEKHLKQKHSMC